MIFTALRAEHIIKLQDHAPMIKVSVEEALDIEDSGGWAAVDHDDCLGCASISFIRPGVGRAWSILTHGWRKHANAITAKAIAELDRCPLRRIEAEVMCDFDAGHRWLRRLGFEMEAERMRAYGPEGQDMALYARVK